MLWRSASFVQWKRTTRESIGKRLAIDQLHDECSDRRSSFDAVDDRDARMIE